MRVAGSRRVRATAGALLPALVLVIGSAAHAHEVGIPLQAETQVLPEVRVTARQREEIIRDVPASIAVLDGEDLESGRLHSIGDLERRVANLQLGDLNGVRTLNLRGVGGGGRQVGFEPRTGVYVDGVFVGAPPITDSLLFDLDRVEVIRGPQGSRFGHNTVSCAVSLITREPAVQPAVETRFGVADGGERRAAAAVDMPLARSALRMRFSASVAQYDGFTRNLGGGPRLDAGEEAAGRVRLLWLADDHWRIDVAADLALQQSRMPTGEAVTSTRGNGPAEEPQVFVAALNTPQRDDLRNGGASATVVYSPAAWSLTSISAFRHAERRWIVDLDYSPQDYNLIDYTDRYPRWSQELRLRRAWPAHGVDASLGLYYAHQKPRSQRTLLALSQIGDFAPQLEPGDFAAVEPEVRSRSAAVFGTLAFDLLPDWRLDAGLRGTWVRQDLHYVARVSEGYQALGAAHIPLARDDHRRFSLAPDVALSHLVGPDTRAYVRYARAIKDGGYDADQQIRPSTQPARFGPETVDTLEAGFKSQWLQRRLAANAALFVAEYRDYQVSQFRPVGTLVIPQMTNAGKVRNWGPELELALTTPQGLDAQLSAAWLHAEYVHFEDGGGAGVDFSGNRTEFSPRWTGALRIDQDFAMSRTGLRLNRMQASLNYAWRSAFFTQPSNLPVFRADARSLLGVRLALTDAHEYMELALHADNLLDERYVNAINRGTLGTRYVRRGDPRRIGLTLSLRWD